MAMNCRHLYNPRNQIGVPNHQQKTRWDRQFDNPYDPSYAVRSNAPDARTVAGQAALATKVSTYQTNGLVQVVPKTTPAPTRGPTSWPPIPPAYVPRPGTLVAIPWEETAQPDSRPLTQIHGTVPVIYRSARQQNRTWPNLSIDLRGLDADPVNSLTSGRDYQSYDKTKYLKR